MEQNHSNHTRYVPGFHFVLSSLITIVFIAAIVNLIHILCCCNGAGCAAMGCCWWFGGVAPLIASVILILLFWYSRVFALRVQDRVIRTEENMRHFIMTGKPLDTRLTIGQIIALRFAGDDEYLSLIERAVNEHMKSSDIKKAIKNWRSDDNRC